MERDHGPVVHTLPRLVFGMGLVLGIITTPASASPELLSNQPNQSSAKNLSEFQDSIKVGYPSSDSEDSSRLVVIKDVNGELVRQRLVLRRQCPDKPNLDVCPTSITRWHAIPLNP